MIIVLIGRHCAASGPNFYKEKITKVTRSGREKLHEFHLLQLLACEDIRRAIFEHFAYGADSRARINRLLNTLQIETKLCGYSRGR